MKTLVIIACAAAMAGAIRAEQLSAADREALLESLDKLKQNAEARVEARFRAAVTAYREALASEDATMDFYLKCVEKVNFDDQPKKNSAFRDWKRRESDRLSSGDFRLALRAQLKWLIIYLQSASDGADRAALAADAQTIVDAVFEDPARLRTHQETLSQPVTGTVFARAYEIGGLEKIQWPQSPVELERYYNDVIFPLYRKPSGLESLRAAWLKRIRQEAVRAEAAGGGGGEKRNGLSPAPRSPEADRFTMETLPELQWQMEVDLFRSGDESGAAKRMLEHITSNITHRSSRAWGDQFRALLTPRAAQNPSLGNPEDTGS